MLQVSGEGIVNTWVHFLPDPRLGSVMADLAPAFCGRALGENPSCGVAEMCAALEVASALLL